MFSPLSTEQEQLQAYAEFTDQCGEKFENTYDSTIYRFFSDDKKRPDLADFGLSVIQGKKFLALSLDFRRPGSTKYKMVVKCSTFSKATGTSRVAAILAKDTSGRVALLHNGNVSPAHGRPGFGKQVRVGERSYFFVSFLNDASFFSHLVDFHRSRDDDAFKKVVKRRLRKGTDLGPASGVFRPAIFCEARHHPIARAVLDYLLERGYRENSAEVVAPDILVRKGTQVLLFEIKPTNESRDLMMGCAQLLIYDKFIAAHIRCLVAARPNDDPFANAIGEFMAENSIYFVEYRIEGDDIVFHDLDRLLQ